MPNTEQLLYGTENSSHRTFSTKMLLLKIVQYLRENTYLCEIFKNTYFEENLRTAALELTLQSDYLKLCF